MAKEFERAGIPTTVVSTLLPLAQSVGPNRIVAGMGVTHPLGDPSLSREEERTLRRQLVGRALDALRMDAQEPVVLRLDERPPRAT